MTTTAKVTRSKHGCGTCRRRRKKCDETRPTCLNCRKLAIDCEGYERPLIWGNGVASRGRLKGAVLPAVTRTDSSSSTRNSARVRPSTGAGAGSDVASVGATNGKGSAGMEMKARGRKKSWMGETETPESGGSGPVQAGEFVHQPTGAPSAAPPTEGGDLGSHLPVAALYGSLYVQLPGPTAESTPESAMSMVGSDSSDSLDRGSWIVDVPFEEADEPVDGKLFEKLVHDCKGHRSCGCMVWTMACAFD